MLRCCSDFDIFVEKLNKITKGDYSFKLSGASSSLQSQPEEEDIPNSKSGKKGGRGGKKSSQGKPATAPVKKRQ